MVQVMKKGWVDDVEVDSVHNLGVNIHVIAEEGAVLFVVVIKWKNVEPPVCGFHLTVVPDRLWSDLFDRAEGGFGWRHHRLSKGLVQKKYG